VCVCVGGGGGDGVLDDQNVWLSLSTGGESYFFFRSDAIPASSSECQRFFFPAGKDAKSVKLITHFNLMPRLISTSSHIAFLLYIRYVPLN
jgi:hypothetical protein